MLALCCRLLPGVLSERGDGGLWAPWPQLHGPPRCQRASPVLRKPESLARDPSDHAAGASLRGLTARAQRGGVAPAPVRLPWQIAAEHPHPMQGAPAPQWSWTNLTLENSQAGD